MVVWTPSIPTQQLSPGLLQTPAVFSSLTAFVLNAQRDNSMSICKQAYEIWTNALTSLIRNSPPLRPYSSICLGPYGGPRGGGQFLMSKVPLYRCIRVATAGVFVFTEVWFSPVPESRTLNLDPTP